MYIWGIVRISIHVVQISHFSRMGYELTVTSASLPRWSRDIRSALDIVELEVGSWLCPLVDSTPLALGAERWGFFSSDLRFDFGSDAERDPCFEAIVRSCACALVWGSKNITLKYKLRMRIHATASLITTYLCIGHNTRHGATRSLA